MTAVAFRETSALTAAPAKDARCLVLTVTPPGDTSSQVTVEHFYVEAGDHVREGAAVCLVRSERYVFDLPACAAGVVEEFLAEPGTLVALGQPLLRIGPHAPRIAEAVQTQPPSPATSATPLARRIAGVHSIELGTIQGAGPGGRIRAADVRAVISDDPGPAPSAGLPNLLPTINPLPPVAPMSVPHSMAPTVPQPLARSDNRVSFVVHDAQPFALTAIEVDLPVIDPVARNDARLARRGLDVIVTTFIAHAVVTALIEHPWLNSAWTDEGVIVYGRIDLGILAQVNGSVQLTIVECAADLSLQGLARAMVIAPVATVQRPTFTIMPVAAAWWIETAEGAGSAVVLGIGHPTRRPVVVETPTGSTLLVRDRALLTLAYDARYITQPEADAFLCSVRNALRRHDSSPTGEFSR